MSNQESNQANNEASKKTDFITVLLWQGMLRLAPINMEKQFLPTQSFVFKHIQIYSKQLAIYLPSQYIIVWLVCLAIAIINSTVCSQLSIVIVSYIMDAFTYIQLHILYQGVSQLLNAIKNQQLKFAIVFCMCFPHNFRKYMQKTNFTYIHS